MNQQQGHSEEFINEMKQRLQQEKEELDKELGSVAHEESDGDYEANFPEYGRDDEDNATEIADYQATSSTTETMEERLKEVTKALERINEGTYGVTEEGELIPEERLKANPAATTLVKK